MNEFQHFEFEKKMKNRPHIVILGAGATLAVIPNGDKNGLKTSVMDGFLEKLGMKEIISSVGLKTESDNLEDIYSELAEKDEYKEIREKLDESIRNYFNSFCIPDEVTIYDLLILSLRKKDLIATFNWDPLLIQAYGRARKITDNVPSLAILHGNVSAGYCSNHERCGLVTNFCPECGEKFVPSRLLYPIKSKNYNSDPFTKGHWDGLKDKLKQAYLVTIFGYSAPKTDVEAISMLKTAWGDVEKRNLENFEFIDIKSEEEIIDTWKSDFIHSHHYTVCSNFFDSSLAKYPRRTTEQLFDSTMNCLFTKELNGFLPTTNWDDLKNFIKNSVQEEINNKDTYMTVKHEV
jgi:hypothetical protein